MADEDNVAKAELIAGDEVRQGVAWIGRKLREVKYTVVDGKAIVEGCIVLGEVEHLEKLKAKALAFDGGLEAFGTTIVGPEFKWPLARVPYTIEDGFPQLDRVTGAIAHWEQNTVVRFVKRTAENKSLYRDYVTFRKVASGCGSQVGRQKCQQFIDIADSCSLGNVIHEIGHAVGLWHEQSREDRGDHVRLHLDSVPDRLKHNFDQHIYDGDDRGSYDFASIMHYPANAFSSNNSVTIEPLDPSAPGVDRMGQRTGLSAGDIAAVAALYA